MSDGGTIIGDLGRIGLTADGAGNLSVKGLTLNGVPVGNQSAAAVNTVSNATITAANLLKGNIIRGGAQSGSAFTDTTDTASLIYTGFAMPTGASTKLSYVNNTNATCTLVGGTGVNSAGTIAVIPAGTQIEFLLVLTSSSAVTITILNDGTAMQLPEAAGTLATNGAGTVTGALIAGRTLNRTTVAAAFTDTTDTGALIFAAIPNALAGESFQFSYNNTTNSTCTLVGGTNVNSAATICLIPAGSTAKMLVTLTSATVVTVTVQSITNNAVLQEVITSLSTAGAGSITAAMIAGGMLVRTGPTTAFTDTPVAVAGVIAAIPNAFIGQSFTFTYQNSSAHDATLANVTGITFSGITVVPAGNTVVYLVTYTAASTLTFVAVSSAAASTQFTPVAKVATPISFVTTTTLQNIPGLSVPVATSGTYAFRAYLTGVSTTNGGLKLGVANSGSTTTVAYTGSQFNNAVPNAATSTTTMGNAVGASTTLFTHAIIDGVTAVNAGGNLTVQAAQNASHADTTTINAGSTFIVTRIA